MHQSKKGYHVEIALHDLHTVQPRHLHIGVFRISLVEPILTQSAALRQQYDKVKPVVFQLREFNNELVSNG